MAIPVYGVPVKQFSGDELLALNTTVTGVSGITWKALAAVMKSTGGWPMGAAVDRAAVRAAVLSTGICIAAVLTRTVWDSTIEADENINIFQDVREIITSFAGHGHQRRNNTRNGH